jgi:hypothetical protein
MELEQKLKVALDESRLLILGAQVLFGFQFEGAFQEAFSTLPAESKMVHSAGVMLLLLSICLLIAPSMHHQIVYAGESRNGALETATLFAGSSLLPLVLGLGASTYVIFEHLFGPVAGVILAGALTLTGTILLYGFGFVLKAMRKETTMPTEEHPTPLKAKIEQMLTEARVLIPGAQALLGFQFIATLTKSFQELPQTLQLVHVGGLCAVALAAMLLMTPAAVHRIAYDGEDNATFFRIGSALVIGAALPLAIGMAADVAVVFYKITQSFSSSFGAGAAALALLLGMWFGYPTWLRHSLQTSVDETGHRKAA